MKLKINKTIEVCDLCQREGSLAECTRCHCLYCIMCDSVIPGCVVRAKVCNKCGVDPKVIKICDQYAVKLIAIIQDRDKRIAKRKAAKR